MRRFLRGLCKSPRPRAAKSASTAATHRRGRESEELTLFGRVMYTRAAVIICPSRRIRCCARALPLHARRELRYTRARARAGLPPATTCRLRSDATNRSRFIWCSRQNGRDVDVDIKFLIARKNFHNVLILGGEAAFDAVKFTLGFELDKVAELSEKLL